MTEVQILTPRGVNLAGTFVNPVDTTDAAVVFSHSFLADRHSGQHFDRLSAAYRGAGYATLEFDYSGCGDSDDDIITSAGATEDLQSASAWLAERGFVRQLLHAHSFGTIPALRSCPPAVVTMVLTGMISGPLSFDWTRIFSSSQLDDLERNGVALILDDNQCAREHFMISHQTLIDLSMNRPEELFTHLSVPVLAIFDHDDESLGLVEMAQESFSLMPDGSHIEVARAFRFGIGEGVQTLRELSVAWARRHLPVR